VDDRRAAAHRRAFALLEAVQSDDQEAAAGALEAAMAEAHAWPEVLFVLAAARVVHAIVRPTPEVDTTAAVDALLQQAPGPAAVAVARGLQALVAAGQGDIALLLAGTSRAIALLDEPDLPGMERCLGYVISAAALNTVRLWELTDELYTRALDVGPAAHDAGQVAAVAVNRVLIRFEWGLTLLEHGDLEGSHARLAQAADAAPAALALELPPLWRHNVEAVADLVLMLDGAPPTLPLEEHREALLADGDEEVLPLLAACRALMAWQRDGDSAPARELLSRTSTSSSARSFPLWVRAEVLAAEHPSPAVEAQRQHAQRLAALLWESRSAVLSAARAQIAAERRHAEHERLSLAVHTDPLTGLHNRRRFDDWLQRPGAAGPTALLLLDLDGFKSVNDTYGHAVGDEVLRRVGLIVRSLIRPADLAMRQGGDEFAVVLHETTRDVVLGRAQALADAVAQADWEAVQPGLRVTASIGASEADLGPGEVAGPALYAAADQALYRSKAGHQRPVLAPADSLTTPGSADR
jgi:diguanylate cyclase (GGDEF)-like protein